MHAEHPDLVEIDRHIRTHLDRVLRAEQEAAELARRRSATIRDRLIDLEERGDTVILTVVDGELAGVIDSVGADHADVMTSVGITLLPLASIAGIRLL